MVKKVLGFESLPRITVAEGATSPDPGEAGVWAWSTTLNRPVLWTGALWTVNTQIYVSDTAPSTPFTGQLWFDTSA